MEKILIVGGGTAGHLFPSLSILPLLKEKTKELEIRCICAKNNTDKPLLVKYLPQENIYELPVAKWRRYFSIQNFLDLFIFIRNILWGLGFLIFWRPHVIFAKGGFVSLPIGISAWILRIPIIMHETDSVMGLSNKIIARFSSKVLCGFPSPIGEYVGNPVRKEFFNTPSQKEKSKLSILVFGGSQGSQALNTWTRNFFTSSEFQNLNITLITGKGNLSKKNISNITEKEFLNEEFINILKNADIVITRAGGSISELAASKKCSILIPLSSAASNHQFYNAQTFAQKNAAILIEEKDLYSNKTKQIIQSLIQNPEERRILEENITKLSTPKSSEKIVKIICSFFPSS